MKLRLSEDLALPLDAITQTFGILAMRGAGKSNTAAVMAEEMFKAGLPFVVVDPVGAWFGLRSSADGKEPGLSIPIFGGRHGDVPLEKTGGHLLADTVVDERLSCVLDISELSEGDKTRFLIDFAERLYRRNQDPLHLFLEEADDYAPQRPFREQARLLRAWENVIRRGRARGLGITMITQRSAALNKNVLTQIETLFVLRTSSPQDRKAIGAWVEYHGQAKELLESLPELKAGEAWVWSPQYLKTLKRVQIRRRETFDSGATPKDVKGRRPPTSLADVDLGSLQKRMAATIERAKAEDPRELRRRIAELQLEVKKACEREAAPIRELVHVPFVPPAVMDAFLALEHRLDDAHTGLTKATDALQQSALEELNRIRKALDQVSTARPASTPRQEPRRSQISRPAIPPHGGNGQGPKALPLGEKKVLTAIAQHSNPVTREQLTVLTGYKRSSRDTYLQRLREKGFVEDRDGSMVATAQGAAALPHNFEPLPFGDELRQYWLERLPKGERRVLQVLVDGYPREVTREILEGETGYKRSSRDTYIQRLIARQLVKPAGRGAVRASEELFS